MAASVAEGCGDRRRGEAVAAGDAQHPMTACAAGHVRARVTSIAQDCSATLLKRRLGQSSIVSFVRVVSNEENCQR
jgi:hypothetical protein